MGRILFISQPIHDSQRYHGQGREGIRCVAHLLPAPVQAGSSSMKTLDVVAQCLRQNLSGVPLEGLMVEPTVGQFPESDPVPLAGRAVGPIQIVQEQTLQIGTTRLIRPWPL